MGEFGSVSEWDDGTTSPQNPVRSPSKWGPIGQFEVEDSANLVGSAKWQQVLGPLPGRRTFTIVNIGANDCEISNEPQSAGVHGVGIAVGGEWSEDTEDEVWVFCNGGTFLDVSQTYTPLYDTVSTTTPGGEIPYIADLLP